MLLCLLYNDVVVLKVFLIKKFGVAFKMMMVAFVQSILIIGAYVIINYPNERA